MTDVVQVKTPEFRIKLVDHTVVPNAKFEFAAPLKTSVRKTVKTRTHIVHFALHRIPN